MVRAESWDRKHQEERLKGQGGAALAQKVTGGFLLGPSWPYTHLSPAGLRSPEHHPRGFPRSSTAVYRAPAAGGLAVEPARGQDLGHR